MFVQSVKIKFLAIVVFIGIIYYVLVINTRQDVSSIHGSGNNNITSHVFKKKENRKVTVKQTMQNVPNIKVKNVNCKALFVGDPFEQKLAEKFHSNFKVENNFDIPSEKNECESYLSNLQFAKEPVNDEEEEFPIAFSILVYKDFHQFQRLLRAIYRPQNYYCIHIDSKSDKLFKDGVKSLVNCFDDHKIFILPISFDVQWATITVLNPEIECMKELWNRFSENINSTLSSSEGKSKKKPKWKYFINLTGQEFPLRTNLELVRILKIFNGSNNMEATRARMQTAMLNKFSKQRAPGNLKIWKGSVHVIASREFVDFAIHHPVAGELLDYLNDVWVPDEHFFSTLNNSPNFSVPGGYTGQNPETDSVYNRFLVRFKNWGYTPFGWPCRGQWVRQICNFGVGDLPLLASRDEMFANKFDYSYQPLAYDCMEELLYNRTKREYIKGFYEKQVKLKIKNKIPVDQIYSIDDYRAPKINETEVKKIVESYIKNHPNETLKKNKDHFILPDEHFLVYGDEEDGQGEKNILVMETRRYLESLRPLIHTPGEVDFEHYKDLDFVRNHLTVPEDWVFEFDHTTSTTMQNLKSKKSDDSITT